MKQMNQPSPTPKHQLGLTSLPIPAKSMAKLQKLPFAILDPKMVVLTRFTLPIARYCQSALMPQLSLIHI